MLVCLSVFVKCEDVCGVLWGFSSMSPCLVRQEG